MSRRVIFRNLRSGLSLWLAGAFLLPCAWAASYTLFDQQGRQSSTYNEIMSSVGVGDTVTFGNGKTIRLGKLLGTGNTTLIFELAENKGQAIRLPKKSGYFSDDYRYVDFIRSFEKGLPILEKHHIPAVQVHEIYRGEYAIVDRVQPDLTFRRFLHDPKISNRLRLDMVDALVTFARETAMLEHIGDFHQDQLVYDGPRKKWILLDWTHSHKEVIFDEERYVRASPNIFLDKAGAGGARYDFFSSYTERIVGTDGQITWTAKKPAYQWIARAANRVNRAVTDERLKILKTRAGSAIPVVRRTQSCMSSFIRSFLSQR
ncbi:MAG: hypothetical protein A2070_03680 [Bdellovibrionales bacterium GWC1_52_8]|nr:MAG: hypothetical protein A2070_03680 [Bdellovibrionales bacterium GWC1_52_8]